MQQRMAVAVALLWGQRDDRVHLRVIEEAELVKARESLCEIEQVGTRSVGAKVVESLRVQGVVRGTERRTKQQQGLGLLDLYGIGAHQRERERASEGEGDETNGGKKQEQHRGTAA